MKSNPLQKFRRLFLRPRKYNTTATRAASMSYDEDDNSPKLSAAFFIVLALHIVAVFGVFAFARLREQREAATPPVQTTQTAAAGKAAAAAGKTTATAAPATVKPAASLVPSSQSLRPSAGGPGGIHIVKEGETLTKIAFAYHSTVPEFITANKLKNQDDIQIGQALNIPEAKQAARTEPTEAKPAVAAAATPQTSAAASTAKSTTTTQKSAASTSTKKAQKTHVVRKGDTATKIAREHGCTCEALLKLNGIKDPKKIQAGQVLKIPAKNG